MRIQLVDVDSTIPNLALMKLSAYHKEKGDEVGFDVHNPDKVYASVIFKKNKQQAMGIKRMFDDDIEVVMGGSGWDLETELPEGVEYMKPDYDLYEKRYPEWEYAMGYTTRGCFRNCYFCIVRDKEGFIHKTKHPREFYDERYDKIKLLDNNVLYYRDWFEEVIDWSLDKGIQLEWNQGLDIRMMTPEVAQALKRMDTWIPIKFAFDDLKIKDQVFKGIEMLKEAGIDTHGNVMFYVYCHNDDHVDSALKRCNMLKERNTCPYVMLNIDKEPSPKMKRLKSWANGKNVFWSTTFEEFLEGQKLSDEEKRQKHIEKMKKEYENNVKIEDMLEQAEIKKRQRERAKEFHEGGKHVEPKRVEGKKKPSLMDFVPDEEGEE